MAKLRIKKGQNLRRTACNETYRQVSMYAGVAAGGAVGAGFAMAVREKLPFWEHSIFNKNRMSKAEVKLLKAQSVHDIYDDDFEDAMDQEFPVEEFPDENYEDAE